MRKYKVTSKRLLSISMNCKENNTNLLPESVYRLKINQQIKSLRNYRQEFNG